MSAAERNETIEGHERESDSGLLGYRRQAQSSGAAAAAPWLAVAALCFAAPLLLAEMWRAFWDAGWYVAALLAAGAGSVLLAVSALLPPARRATATRLRRGAAIVILGSAALAFAPDGRQWYADLRADCSAAAVAADPPAVGNAAPPARPPGPALPDEPDVRWHYPIDGRRVAGGSVAMAGSFVVLALVPSSTIADEPLPGGVLALDARTGVQRWSAALDLPSATLVDQGRVIVAAAGPAPAGTVALDAATGDRRWRSAHGWLSGGALVASGAILRYEGDESGVLEGLISLLQDLQGEPNPARLVALDPETGGRCWSADLAAVPPGSTLAVAGGLVYGAGRGGDLAAMEATTGREIWHVPLTPPAGLGLRPTVAAGLLVVSTADGLLALNAANGVERWRRADLGEIGPPAADTATAYVATGDRLLALDAASGDERWSTRIAGLPSLVDRALDLAGGEGWTPPRQISLSRAGTDLYVTAGDRLLALDAMTGDERWSLTLPADALGPATVIDGAAYVVLVDGVVALGEANEK